MSDLAAAMHSAIGANTRIFLAKVVAIENVSKGRVTAFSEFLGNLEVVVGSIRWLRLDDWIFVTRASSEEKYQPYLYLGWAGNQSAHIPGSPALFNSTTTAVVGDLPTYNGGARLGEIRSVGGTTLGDITTGNTLYIFADINGTPQWVQFGGGAAAQRSFGWYQAGFVTPGTQVGPIYSIDVAMNVSAICYDVKIADVSTPVIIDIRAAAPFSATGASFVSILTAPLSFTTSGQILTGFTPELLAGQRLCFDVTSYAGTAMTDLTVQVFLTSTELP